MYAPELYRRIQWRNTLTGGPWTNYIKGPIPHFEFTEKNIIIKVLTKVTIKHKTILYLLPVSYTHLTLPTNREV